MHRLVPLVAREPVINPHNLLRLLQPLQPVTTKPLVLKLMHRQHHHINRVMGTSKQGTSRQEAVIGTSKVLGIIKLVLVTKVNNLSLHLQNRRGR